MGISPFHDASAVVYCDGKIEYFCKEERLSKNKRDKHPFLAVENCIKNSQGPIDGAVIGSPDPDDFSLVAWKHYLEKVHNIKHVIDLSIQHHLQHASLAFYNSGFQKSLVVVIDRNGTTIENVREIESVFLAEYPCTFKPIIKHFSKTDSANTSNIINQLQASYGADCIIKCDSSYGIVKVYESATYLIKQPALENGKTMGLSSYGNTKLFSSLFTDGVIPDDTIFDKIHYSDEDMTVNKQLAHLSTADITLDNYKLYADYAHQVQIETQDAVVKIIQQAIDATGITNICVTGGYGLNVVANGYYIEKFPNINFYFEPLADDSGNSIGSAMLIYRDKTKDLQIYPLYNTFFNGSVYSLDDVNGSLCTVNNVVSLLTNSKSIGVFQGTAEAGPRALGHRSILFDPRNANAKDLINLVKNREWYRPFACMVLESDVDQYFNMPATKSFPYMTVSFPVKEEALLKIPGVVHVDNTCRIQTVTKKDGIIFELLTEFKKETGVGVLLNTSLNLAGDPLAETVEDAMKVLYNSKLEALWFPEKNILCQK